MGLIADAAARNPSPLLPSSPGGTGNSPTGFLGNLVRGIGDVARGAVSLVGNFGFDAAKEFAILMPGRQQIEDQPFRTAEMVKRLAGFTPQGFEPLDPSSLVGGIYNRYSPLLPGGAPASQTYQGLYENPVGYALDALGLGKIVGKAAASGLGRAVEGSAVGASAVANAEALKLAGFTKTAAERAGLRSALDQTATSPLMSLVSKALPEATMRRVGDVLEPRITPINPVARAVLNNPLMSRIGTEPVSSLASRVEGMRSEIDSYLTNRGWRLDAAQQVVDRSGTSVATKAPKQLVQMAEDYRAAKTLLDQAQVAKLTRLGTTKAAHSLAGGIARKMLGELSASGLILRNQRVQAYVDAIAPDIVAHPQIASAAAGVFQGLDVAVDGAGPQVGWAGRPLEWDGLTNTRKVTLGTRAPLLQEIDAGTRQIATQTAPEWLGRTDDLVASLQRLRDQMEQNPEMYAELDVPDQIDSINRHIHDLSRGVSDIIASERGSLDPTLGTAAKARIVSMEQSQKLWEMGVLEPTQMLDRSLMALRVKYGARYDRVSDTWEKGPPPKALHDALNAAGTSSPVYFPHIDPAEIGPWELFRSKRRVGAITASANPNLKRNTAALLEQGSYITDPTEAFSRVAMRGVRAEETFRVFDAYAKRFGRLLTPGQVKGSNEVYWIPEIQGLAKRTGLGVQDLMDRLTSEGISREQAAAEALKIVQDNGDYVANLLAEGKPVTVYAVPRAVADQLDAAAKWAKVFGPNTKFGAYYDSAMNAWRHLTLFTRPAYVMNQFLGNAAWAEMQGAGLRAPAELIGRRLGQTLSARFGRKIPDEVLAKLEDLPGYRELGGGFFSSLEQTYTPRNPRFEATALGQAMGRAGASRPASWAKAWMGAERKMAVELDTAFRASGYLTAAERAMGIGAVRRSFRRFRSVSTRIDKLLKGGFGNDTSMVVEALNEAKRFYGDFFAMTPFERHFVRRYAFPFWGFQRQNLQLMLRFPIEYPGRAELMSAIERADQEMRAEYGPLPEYLSSSVPFGPPGSTVPFFSMRGGSPFEGVMQPWTSQLGPLPKVLLERAMGKNLFLDRPFSDPNYTTPFGSDQPYQIQRDAQGNVVGVQPSQGAVLPGILEHLLRQFAPYSYAERFAAGGKSTYDTATLLDLLRGRGVRTDEQGQPMGQGSTLSVLGSLAGLPITQVDVAGYQDRRMREFQAALTAALSRGGT